MRYGDDALERAIEPHLFLPGCAAVNAAHRCLEIAFGIDEEVRCDDDGLTFLHAFEHLDVVVGARADLHFARLESALSASAPGRPGARRCR